MLADGRIISGSGLANYQESIVPYRQEGFFYNNGTDPNFHENTVQSADYRDKTWQPLEIYLYPHNIFYNFWTELGLAGMLLFVWYNTPTPPVGGRLDHNGSTTDRRSAGGTSDCSTAYGCSTTCGTTRIEEHYNANLHADSPMGRRALP